MKKLMLNGVEITRGDWMEEPFEQGIVVGIDVDKEEVHVHDGKEGWTLCAYYENLGDLKFVEA